MESKKINQLATELTPALSDLTIIGDPTTGISKKITLSQMASLFTGTVEEYANLASFPLVGTADTIYIALDTNIIYRWNTSTSAYVELSPNIVTSLVFNDANGFDGTISLVGSTATLTITTALTQGSVGFIGASGALTQDNSNFFWDNTNKRLGINTNAPTTAIDAFGSGIIGRLNGTSTNNAFLGFASAGTNKWSIGNVQSDHRFRIYSEATTSELVSVLQTGEFGIGIANPTTKLHIDGGASALIANLDANVSVAKSISFRSDNSARINLEVSGTESGSNAGANFFIRTYTDAGSLLATPLTITRSTGAITLTGALSGTTATFSSDVTLTKLTSATGLEYQVRNTNGASGNHVFKSYNTAILTLDGGTNAATFSSTLDTAGNITSTVGATNTSLLLKRTGNTFECVVQDNQSRIRTFGASGNDKDLLFDTDNAGTTRLFIKGSNGNVGIGTSSPLSLLDVCVLSSGARRLLVNYDDSIVTIKSANASNAGENLRLVGDNIIFNSSSSGNGIERFKITSGGDTEVRSGNKLNIYRTDNTRALQLYTDNNACYIDAWESSSEPLRLRSNGSGGRIEFHTNGTERVRVTSGGWAKFTSTGSFNDLNAQNHEFVNGTAGNNSHFIGNTNASYAGATLLRLNCVRTTTNATYNLIAATNGNSTGEFIVRDSGNCQNTNNSYTGTSDIKLKQDIIDASSQWEDIKQMRIRKFRFKKQVEQDENAPYLLGVIAQELELVSPNLVDETPDFDGTDEEVVSTTKSVKYSIIYMKAVKALQEAMEKIEILEEKVKQLESK